MSRVIHGNLALKTNQQQRRIPQTRTQQKRVTIRHTLPIQEKLLYLLLVVVIVAISGMLLSRYSLMAEINYKIQDVSNQINENQKENDLLQIKVAELSSPDRILKLAEEMGLSQQEGNVKTVRIATVSSMKEGD